MVRVCLLAALINVASSQDKLSLKQGYVIGISLLTVALWCANSWLQRWTGEMGIIAILPLVAFFGFGILGKVGKKDLIDVSLQTMWSSTGPKSA